MGNKKWNTLIVLVAMLFVTMQTNAQVIGTGPVIAFKKIANGIEGKTTNCFFDVRTYGEHTFRVRISRQDKPQDFSYSIVAGVQPSFTPTIVEKGTTIELQTPAITAVVEKLPSLRIIFKNNMGEIINEDVAGENAGTTFIGSQVSSYKTLQEGERFVGLGEVLGNLDKRGSGFTLNNTDTYKYGDPRLSMYISIPFYIGIHHQQVYGLFYHNTWKTFFNFGISTPFASINADGANADYFFFYDSSMAGILQHYTALTGRMPLPPKWSIGYHQSRCSYYPQENVQLLAETFRRKQIPIDGIVLDADYQQGYQPFLVNKKRFPNLPQLSANMARLNIELTASVYPGVKIDTGYFSYTDGLKKDVFLKYANGKIFETEIAPLKVVLPDYSKPAARQWWIDRMRWMKDNGIRGYWNDMNEPAVGGSYLPGNVVFDFDGRKVSALEGKNIYGFQMARSSYDAAVKHGEGKRPFVLTRSAFAGVQRYAAVWSGDNTASNDGLLSGVLLNSQMGLSGLPFVGPDLGGYIGDGTKDLFKRWMEVGVFSPYVRNHKEFFATANEPWSYGEEAEAISLAYIGFRYRLLPYVYSAFYTASQNGTPIARSLCMSHPFDSKVYDGRYQYQFMFGDALMVVPVTTDEKSKTVYLPKGEWIDLFTEEKLSGEKEVSREIPIYQIPVFVKAGAIIPMQRAVQSTRDDAGDTLMVHLFNGSTDNSFGYYEDNGDDMQYQQGAYCKKTIAFFAAQKRVVFSKQQGSFVSSFKKIQLVLHGFDGVKTATVNGALIQAVAVKSPMLDPLAFLEDYYDPAYFASLRQAQPVLQQQSIVFNNSSDQLIIQLQ